MKLYKIKKEINNKVNSAFSYAKRDLLSSRFDIIATFIISLFTIYIFNQIIYWLINTANWEVITKNLPIYIYGSFPQDKIWRPLLWLTIMLILVVFTLTNSNKNSITKYISTAWLLIIPAGLFLLSGGGIFSPVLVRNWGGLILTLMLTGSSLIISLPLGVLLALGRQIELKSINLFCKIYIDVMRAFPLITVLFFGQLLIPLFLPVDFEINRVFRAVLAFAAFTSAYIAEDVRGGIQSIPITQKEAAEVLGLSPLSITQLIILPQALRTALPSLTNQVIGLLQNTSLMAILGLVELLGISRSILANPNFIGNYLEVYVWLAIVYWSVCTFIALISKRIEITLNRNIRRV